MPNEASNLDLQKKSNEKCSAIVGGLKLCTPSAVITVKLGDPIPLKTSLQNVSDKDLAVSTFGGFNSLYKVSIRDSDNKKLHSKKEALKVKASKGLARKEELIKALPVGSSRLGANKVLKPEEKLNLTHDLSKFYDFNKKGTYKVMMSRILGNNLVSNPSEKTSITLEEISFGTIEIQVK